MVDIRRLEIARGPEAATAARRDLDHWLNEQGCDSREDALLALSELVNNAVIHAAGDPVVVMSYTDDRIRLEVPARRSAPPVRREPGVDRPGGYGLNIIDTLSEEWGWTATDGGKMVWCHLFC